MTGLSPKRVSPAARWLTFGLVAVGVGAIGLAAMTRGEASGPGDNDEVDLSVKVAPSTDVGDDFQRGWTFTVVNQGPAVAEGSINLVATLPASLETVSLDGEGWTCEKPVDETRIKTPVEETDDEPGPNQQTEPVKTVTCSHGEKLAVRKSTSLVLTGTSKSQSETEVNVAVSGPSTDPDLIDNVAWFAIGGQKNLPNPSEGQEVAQSDRPEPTSIPPATNPNDSTAANNSADDDEELPRTGPALTLTSVWFGAAFIGLGYLLVDWSNKHQDPSPQPDRG